MSTELDGLSERPLITHAPTLGVVIERTPFVVPPKAEPLEIDRSVMDKILTLTWWEKVTLFTDDLRLKAKLTAAFAPHVFLITLGLAMKSWKTLVTGIIGFAVVLIQYFFGVVVPQEIVLSLTAAIGLFFSKDSNVTGGTVQQ